MRLAGRIAWATVVVVAAQNSAVADSWRTIVHDYAELLIGAACIFLVLIYALALQIRSSRRSLARVQESERVYRTLVEALPDGVYMCDQQSTVLFTNSQLARDLKLESQLDVVGKNIAAYVASADHPRLRDAHVALLQGVPLVGARFTVLRPDGTTFPGEISVRPVIDARGGVTSIIGIVRNISEKLQREQRLRDSEEKFREIVEVSTDWVWEVGPDARYTYASARVFEILGYAPEQIIGRSPMDFMPPEEAAKIGAIFGKAWSEGKPVVHLENVNIHANGLPVTLETTGLPLFNAQGEVCGFRGVDRDITERKANEERLRLLNAELEDRVMRRTSQLGQVNKELMTFWEEVTDLYDNAPCGYLSIDREGKIVRVNSMTLRWLGFRAEEVLGLPFRRFLETKSLEAFHKQFASFVQECATDDLEFVFTRKDGTHFPAVMSSTAIKNARGEFVMSRSTIFDLTDRKAMEAALQESELRYRTMFEQAPIGIYRTTPSGEVLLANSSMLRILGYTTLKDLAAVHIESHYTGNFRRRDFVSRIEENGYVQGFETSWVRPDGKITQLRENAIAVRDPRGKTLYYEGTVEDITDIKEAEWEMRQALEKERELSELKSRFVSTTSHEFRTPLTSIMTSTEMLEEYLDRWPIEMQRKHLRRIRTSVERMTELMNDVLLVGKSEAGKLRCEPLPVDVDQLCADIVAEIRHASRDSRIIRFAPSGLPDKVLLDEKLVRQIATNLLSNAVKYSAEGSVVNFTIHPANGSLVFTFQDHGIGIPDEDRDRLFQIFHRASNVNTIPGTGLGLTIVKHSAEVHGGTIHVSSQVNVGSTFTVSLPLHTQPSAHA